METRERGTKAIELLKMRLRREREVRTESLSQKRRHINKMFKKNDFIITDWQTTYSYSNMF